MHMIRREPDYELVHTTLAWRKCNWIPTNCRFKYVTMHWRNGQSHLSNVVSMHPHKL